MDGQAQVPIDAGGRYRVGPVLGEGGQSIVYGAVDLERGAAVALKVLAPAVDLDAGRILLRREFAAMSGLDHPSIVRVFDFGALADGRPFFTMERVDGLPLTALLRDASEARVLEALYLVLDALDVIHARGVVHGDVKPSNLLATLDGERLTVRLLDFGLAAVSGLFATDGNVIRGSIPYLAPEVIRSGPADGRADLYSVGATFYEVVSGRPPFEAARPEEVLRKHLDVEPPPLPDADSPLAAIVMRLLEKDPRLRFARAGEAKAAVASALGGGESGARAARPWTPLAGAFVGRDVLVDLALAAVDDAARVAGGLIVYEGAEGSGKSRLLSDLATRCALLEQVTVTRPRAAGDPAPYAAWRGLASTLAVRPGAGPRPPVGMLAPAGADVPVSDLDVDGRRARLFEQACQWLAGMAHDGDGRPQPIVVLLDDLDRMDGGSRDFLGFLARQLKGLPVCVVATVSTPADRALYSDLARWHRIEPLTMTQSGVLAATMLGVSEVPRGLASVIHEESAGNPADVEDFVRALLDEGAIVRTPGGSLEVHEGLLGNVPTPRRVEEWVKRHTAALDAESRVALSVASLLPEPFVPELLSRTLGFSEELTFDVLLGLERQGVVVCQHGGYQVAGTKLRGFLRDGLAAGSRRDLSDRIARALTDVRARKGAAAVPDALLADYLEHGRSPRTAVSHLMAASDEAYALLSLRDSIDYLKRAVALVISDEDGIDRDLLASARERLAERLADAGDVADSVGIYESLLQDVDVDSSPEVGTDPELWAGVRLPLKLAKLHHRRGEYERSHDALRDVLARLDREQDAGLISEVLARLSWIFKARGIYPEAIKYGQRALSAALESGDPSRVANAENNLGLVSYGKGDLEQGHHCFRRALRALAGAPASEADQVDELELALRPNVDPVRARVIVNNLGNVHWKRGEWDRATSYYETALQLAERVGDLSGLAAAANNLALIRFGRGDWDGAILGFERALDIKAKLGEAAGLSVGLNNLAEVFERVGRWHEAREHYQRSLEIKLRLGEKKGAGLVLLTLGNLYRKMGELRRAAREVERGFGILGECGDTDALAFGHYYRALLHKDREDFAAALRDITEALALLERMRTYNETARITTSAADLYVRMGDLERAQEFADRSLALARELGDRFEEGKTLSIVGRIRYQRRERVSAREAFEQGIAILEELGARFEVGRSAYEFGLRIEDPSRAARYLEKAIGIFRAIGAVGDLDRATGTYERIRENLQGFDAPSQRAAGEVVGLYETGKLINSTLDLDEVLDRVMDLVLERTRADRGLILLLDADGRLRVRAARNIAKENLKGISDISESIVHEVIRTQGPLLASNASLDPRFSAQQSVILHGIVSIAAVPLAIRDRMAGAIYLDHLKEPDYFTSKDLKFLQALADQAAIAIENARLYRELREASDRLAAENRFLRAETRGRHGSEIVGGSRAIRRVVTLLEKAASTGETTLMLGESGTGKSFLARAIHDIGPRRDGPFVKFNCAALPESLVESELFGHEKGAFTGADRRKLGRFEIASSGTIFVDEIGNVSSAVQAKLLRILEDKEFERVGGTQTLKSDAHIIAATNRNLEKAIRDGSFREDLFYRLNIFPIQLPPLRDRKEDVPQLAERFLADICAELALDRKGFTPDALDVLVVYDWPGNVRELESAVRRAAVLAEGEVIRGDDLRFLRGSEERTPRREVLLDEAVEAFVRAPRRGEKVFQAVTENVERVLIRKVLQDCSGQIREAARRLGVARNTLRSKMKRYGLAGKDES